MKTISLFTLILLTSLTFIWSCASHIPLTQLEKMEYQRAIAENPDSMDFYASQQQGIERTPMSVRVIRSPSSDMLLIEMVKSRRTFSGWTKFKRVLLSREIKREELDIRTNLY